MVFKVNATLGNVRMSGDEWTISFKIPDSDSTEVAKICLACKNEPLIVKVETEQIEPIGQAQ